MKKRMLSILLCTAMTVSLMAGCGGKKEEAPEPEAQEEEAEVEEEEEEAEEEEAPAEEPEVDNASAVPATLVDIDKADAAKVEAFMSDSDEKTILVDARPQESYAGWALEGAKNGGHLKNAALFSARWLDCEIKDARTSYLTKAMAEQNITADSSVIVYDYSGAQANVVANYLKGQGVEDVTVFQANEMIDAGKDLVSYKNYDRFLPTEIVKSVSDVMTGKEKELTAEAKALFPDGLDKVVLVDVSWGNAKTSAYFGAGHVPGAVHINTDCYERPRVYVPEKRSEYAKEWRLIPLAEFRDTICPQYGITKDSTVIVTGPGTAPLGRLSFMLRSVGVKKVYVMDGCLTAWKYNGYDLDHDNLVIPTSVKEFGSKEIPGKDEIVWNDTIEKILSGEVEGTVADNRGAEEWNGEYSGYGYHDLAGHPDGAVWCSQTDENGIANFCYADNTARTTEELTAYMTSKGVDPSKLVAFFCGDSWGAAFIAYWCQSSDLDNIKEWGTGWIPWSNEGHEFIDHNGNLVHYDKYLDTVVDASGKDMRDGVNILDDATK